MLNKNNKSQNGTEQQGINNYIDNKYKKNILRILYAKQAAALDQI
jgi:hypothetical protein